jgi:ABC-type phosphate/phosphonate transport system substrate-binding protein
MLIAALPMYDFPELRADHDALWDAVSKYLVAAGVSGAPGHLTRNVGHAETWGDPRLLLGQGCEYPLAKSFADTVRLVASPCFVAPGCDGATYRSAIVVREDDPAATLADLCQRRCVINEADSNSGMNLLRATLAPLAKGRRFFQSVQHSGSHLRSAEMVGDGRADVAALDCVSLAHFRRLYPSITAKLRILDWTVDSPSLPLITARGTTDDVLQKLRSSLSAVLADPALKSVRERLLLENFDVAPRDDYAVVLGLERRAAEQGYPVLA